MKLLGEEEQTAAMSLYPATKAPIQTFSSVLMQPKIRWGRKPHFQVWWRITLYSWRLVNCWNYDDPWIWTVVVSFLYHVLSIQFSVFFFPLGEISVLRWSTVDVTHPHIRGVHLVSAWFSKCHPNGGSLRWWGHGPMKQIERSRKEDWDSLIRQAHVRSETGSDVFGGYKSFHYGKGETFN